MCLTACLKVFGVGERGAKKLNFFFGVKILFLDLVTTSNGRGGIIAGGFGGCWLCDGR